LQDLVLPPEWNKTMAEIMAPSAGKPPAVFICGPKGSGKSTFGRLLGNKLLTVHPQSKAWSAGVAVLDMDPGQPEFAPAGLVSLVHCQTPTLSPPFAHALADGSTTTICRSHALGSLTPASDPQLFAEACLDLFAHYTRTLSQCPLIVNTPGWIQGTGLDLLVDLIAGINPSHVVYMSEEGPAESVDGLSGAARGRFITLPSQQSECSPRTAAQLRAMQTMAYFHGRIDGSLHAWSSMPVTAKVPWEVRYGGGSPGIAAVLGYEYQPPVKLLAAAINGAVLSLVEIEDVKALRDLAHKDSDSMSVDNDSVPTSKTAAVNIPATTISRSPEGIPFIANPNSTSLDPAHSQALGLVLIRGIDPGRQSFQLLTPVPIKRIEQARIAGHSLVLVLGKLDTPSWAYTEDMYGQAFDGRRNEPAGGPGGDGEDDDDDDSDQDEEKDENETESGDEVWNAMRSPLTGADVPWVETVEGHEKRPVGSKTWRVRRDLGRGG
jgi:polynucleotide 5'-hydroxyl-kinase GRC3/NOL9